jgi:hypothetical protein
LSAGCFARTFSAISSGAEEEQSSGQGILRGEAYQRLLEIVGEFGDAGVGRGYLVRYGVSAGLGITDNQLDRWLKQTLIPVSGKRGYWKLE